MSMWLQLSAQPIRRVLDIEYRSLRLGPHALILEHPRIHPGVLALDLQRRLGRHGVPDEVIVAMRAVLIAVLKLLGVFSEALLAFLARKDLRIPVRREGEGRWEREAYELKGLLERVVFLFGVAFRAVEPLATWAREPQRPLSREGGENAGRTYNRASG